MKGLIYREQVVIKPGPIPTFYHHCPLGLRPPKLHTYGETYVYGYVPGRQATAADLSLVLDVCEKQLWHPRQWLAVDRGTVGRYCDYVRSRMLVPDAVRTQVAEDALAVIMAADHPAVTCVHGDMTFENTVITPEGNVVFVDPGDPRGMLTPGIDRGKLLQSAVMRWEDRAWDDPLPWPDWATLTDWAFLVTHWVRLVRHWPELPTLTGFDTLKRIRPCESNQNKHRCAECGRFFPCNGQLCSNCDDTPLCSRGCAENYGAGRPGF